ncbi:ligand-binding sensor domain-containing protein [Terrisporobacter sp.]
MTRKIVTIIMIVFFAHMFMGETYAANYLNFENLTIDDGLSQSTGKAILQDSNGYIWIGTSDGLNRYNGLEIKVFKCNKLDETSLVDNNILSLQEDKNKKLWVGTSNGVSAISLEDYSIKNYKIYKGEKNKKFHDVHTILATESNHILIGTNDGIYLYNEKVDAFDKVIQGSKLASTYVRCMVEDKNNNIWVGTSHGLSKINLKNKKVHTYKDIELKNKEIKDISALICDDENNLWIGTNHEGLYKLNISTGKIESFKSKEEDENTLPSNKIRALLQDKNKTIWIGTDKGISKYIGKDKFITYTNKSYDLNSLSDNYVYSMIQDLSGLLWIGTYTGISKVDPQNAISLYKYNPLDDNALSDKVIHGIYEDDEGLLWIGTTDKGLNIFDRKNDKIQHIYEGNGSRELSGNSIKVITGKNNIIWAGSTNGLNKIDKSDMSVKKITKEDGLICNNIKSLFLDSKGYLWVGTADGVDIIDTNNDEIIPLTEMFRKYDISDLDIEDMYEDNDGVYWLGERISGLLIRINPNDNKAKVYKVNKENDRLSGIMCIKEDNNNNLWLGTINGLYKFNKKTEKMDYYSEENGLSNNNVYGILFDEEGNPWMSTNNGISKLNLKTNKFTTITSTDGLQSNEFDTKAYCKLKSGEFAFGGIKGLNIFNPSDISISSKSPKVTFDIFEVEGKEYNNIDGMSFEYSDKFVRIKFFIPEYKNNSNIQYFYKMEGLSSDWIQIKNNEVIFNELPTGNYTFKIKARSQNGNVGEESRVSFTIKPPIYLSQPAILTYILLIIMLIYYSANKMKMLDDLVSKKTADLSKAMEENKELYKIAIENERSKNNYFINLSHELRTPLNVITSLEQLISTLNKSEKGITREKIDYYMEVMRNNSRRLLNLINNIIDTSKIENGKYKIEKSENDIVYLVEETALSLKDLIEADNIELIIDTDMEEKTINCDKEQIERCIINLISNALKFTQAGGRITVDIKDKIDSVEISVEDTGIGIEEEYHKTIFDRFNQIIDETSEEKGGSGLGLTITKQLVNLHDGDIYVISEKDKGSKFVITLPVG